MNFYHHNKGGRYADEVIIKGNVYSVSKLRSKARQLTMVMWASIGITLLVAMMIVPYLAQAATNANNSDAFSGTVIPGYSMGGLNLTAYGVDINSWGQGSSDQGTFAESNYGIWSGDRARKAKDAASSVSSSSDTTSDQKSSGWYSITQKQNYSSSNPNGQTSSSTSTDVVNPYRTASDSTYWDSQTSSASAATAGITVSLLPEFICVGVTQFGTPTVLTNPDDSTSQISNQSIVLDNSGRIQPTNVNYAATSTAIPYYISLKDLFDAYGLTEASNTMTDLKNAMKNNSDPLRQLVADSSKNLLYGTQYQDLNGGTNESSDAFNPYPYSMVFTKTDNGKQVVSGIYENDEAYVYFSPQSVYQAYVSLQQEYESIAADNATALAKQGTIDASLILMLGYYQAAMSICEAYLSEALPQDMTRGYVGPTEDTKITGQSINANGGNWRNKQGIDTSKDFSDTSNPESFKGYLYATLMYDVANQLIANNEQGTQYELSQTNATMDTLSTFGYSVNSNLQTGVMQGMTAAETYNRMTAFTAYDDTPLTGDGLTNSAYLENFTKNKSNVTAQQNTGIYIAPYYPIQQHAIPSSEASYRFSIITDIPFQTVKAYLSAFGFGDSGTVKLSYSSGNFTTETSTGTGSTNNGEYSTLPTDSQVQAMGTLLKMFQDGTNDDQKANGPEYTLNSTNYQTSESIVLHPDKNTDNSNQSTLQKRVDQALMNYSNSSMTADNVHDLCDVIRAICGLKYETFMRFYNPLKSAGSDPDIYLTRVSPANNSYMPTTLLTGYSAAGGDDIVNGDERTDIASYDYFSIPSFAPCFARHTASDCYYGSLNYELKAFLQIGFLRTLNTGDGGLNIPAVTAMNQVKQEAQDMASKTVASQEDLNTDLTTIYHAAQVLSYYKVLTTLRGGNAKYTLSTLRNYVDSALNDDNGAHHDLQAAKNKGANTNNGWYNPDWTSANDYHYAFQNSLLFKRNKKTYTNENDYINATNDAYDYKDTDQIITSEEGGVIAFDNDYLFQSNRGLNIFNYVAKVDDAAATRFNAKVNDMQDMAHSYYGSYDVSYLLEDVLFSYLYRQKLMSYIGPDGTYYWGLDLTELGQRTGIYSIFDAQALKGAPLKGREDELKESIDKSNFDNQMQEAAEDAFKAISDFNTSLNDLSSAVPSQMQNALAWADYANSSNSQNAYQSDPSTNQTVIITSSTKSDDDTPIVSYATAKAHNIDYTDTNDKVNSGLSTTSSNVNLQAETTRGVEGTTSTATGNPAAYTTTAIISRVRDMNQQDINYPYSGLAASSLIEGADRYTQMQSHVVNYTDIANKLNDDLANWQETQGVTLDVKTPTAGSLNFTVLTQLAAFVSNIVASIVQLSANFFSSQMYPSGTNAGTVKFATSDASADVFTSLMPNTRNSYVAAISIANPNSTRAMIKQTSYNGTAPKNTQGTSTASAADDSSTTNSGPLGSTIGTASINFILNTSTGKSIYKFLQSLALLFVIITLLIIAFQNIMIYNTGNSLSFLSAQTNLKRILPRAVLAVFMIGLPPIGNGTGFQGGGFLLLEVINSIVVQVAKVFSTVEGTGILDMTVQAIKNAMTNDIAAILIIGLIGLIIALLYLIGGVFIFILNLFLFMFFLLSPLAWAAYVWPFTANYTDDGTISGTLFQRITRKLGSKTFTGSRVGSQAAAGFVSTFVDVELIYIIYTLLWWFASFLFVGTAGDSWMSATNSGSSDGSLGLGQALWLGVINGGVIYVMGKLLMDEFHNTNAMIGLRNMANGIWNGIKAGGNAVKNTVKAVKKANIAGSQAARDAQKLSDSAINNDSTNINSNAGIANGLAGPASDAIEATQKAISGKGKNAQETDVSDAKNADKLGQAKTTESGALLVHDDVNDKKEDNRTPGAILKDSLSGLGRGLLDGDSAKVGQALGGVDGVLANGMSTVALGQAFKTAQDFRDKRLSGQNVAQAAIGAAVDRVVAPIVTPAKKITHGVKKAAMVTQATMDAKKSGAKLLDAHRGAKAALNGLDQTTSRTYRQDAANAEQEYNAAKKAYYDLVNPINQQYEDKIKQADQTLHILSDERLKPHQIQQVLPDGTQLSFNKGRSTGYNNMIKLKKAEMNDVKKKAEDEKNAALSNKTIQDAYQRMEQAQAQYSHAKDIADMKDKKYNGDAAALLKDDIEYNALAPKTDNSNYNAGFDAAINQINQKTAKTAAKQTRKAKKKNENASEVTAQNVLDSRIQQNAKQEYLDQARHQMVKDIHKQEAAGRAERQQKNEEIKKHQHKVDAQHRVKQQKQNAKLVNNNDNNFLDGYYSALDDMAGVPHNNENHNHNNRNNNHNAL